MLLNKPPSMDVREWLVKTLSRRDFIPEFIISSIVAHQYDEANLKLKEKNSIEISGFGKFYYNTSKAKKQMVKLIEQRDAAQVILDDESISEKKRHTFEQCMITVDANIEYLKLKE